MSAVFSWLNDQLLRMQWLHDLVRLLVEQVLGLDMASRVGGSIHFSFTTSSRSSSCWAY